MQEGVPNRKVIVHHKMVGMPIFDDQFVCDSGLELYAVVQKIINSHGGTTGEGFRMWLTRVEPGLIVRNFRQTIHEAFSLEHEVPLGTSVIGETADYNVTVYYDFGSLETSCPLLKLHVG
ncbi:uncharacterized protein TM35_000032830 [Trypanosoma theileri]|uniref:Uncharacterized protein n=1 Tax=Trypanosoma theileri TaxID=67003 RepID=A0A1X0P7X3_9TRYP|nr:uncharacterized protein TM35_000032830 [Trypanosoma theileri]ORC92530.1 hypothetical protein TM35_000032830 [Trypanosoma theileri]